MRLSDLLRFAFKAVFIFVLDTTEGNENSESIVILASPAPEDKDDNNHFVTSQDQDIFDLQVGSCIKSQPLPLPN